MTGRQASQYESQEPPARAVVPALAGLLGLLVVVLVTMALLAEKVLPGGWREPPTAPRNAQPEPDVWTDQAAERRLKEGAAPLHLTTGGLSVDEAMAQLAREGWPDPEDAP